MLHWEFSFGDVDEDDLLIFDYLYHTDYEYDRVVDVDQLLYLIIFISELNANVVCFVESVCEWEQAPNLTTTLYKSRGELCNELDCLALEIWTIMCFEVRTP